MIVYRIGPSGGSTCTEKNIHSAIDTLEALLLDADPGASYSIGVSEMSEAEYDALPEFTGF